jgi:hypothetical protein
MAIEGAAEQAAPSSSVSRPQVHRQREERVLRCLAVQAHTLLVRAAGFCDPSLRAQVDGQTGGGALQPIQPPPDGQSIFCAPVKLREADGHDSCPLLLTCGKRRTSTASLNRLRCIRTAVIASTAAATVRRQRGVSLGRCRFVSGSLLGGPAVRAGGVTPHHSPDHHGRQPAAHRRTIRTWRRAAQAAPSGAAPTRAFPGAASR